MANTNAHTDFWSLCHIRRTHGTMSIMKELRMLLPKITKARAVKHTMPLITHWEHEQCRACTCASAEAHLISQACPAQQAENGSPS